MSRPRIGVWGMLSIAGLGRHGDGEAPVKGTTSGRAGAWHWLGTSPPLWVSLSTPAERDMGSCISTVLGMRQGRSGNVVRALRSSLRLSNTVIRFDHSSLWSASTVEGN